LVSQQAGIHVAMDQRAGDQQKLKPFRNPDRTTTWGTAVMILRNTVVLATTACASILTAASLHAQEQQQLEEVLVTARKREESILKVPVVEAVITQESLEKYQTNNLYAVASRVPGFVMGESVGTVGIQTSIRGVGPTSQTATVDQSVSLNIDGLPLTQGYAYTAGMFDVAQVEVLKGPQSLFYGKNSTAGVISLRSADPTDAFEFIARGGYESEAEEKTGELVLSGPVGSAVKLRLAARYSDLEGWFRNTGVPIPNRGNVVPKHKDFAPRESVIVRGTALFEPNDIYEARLKVNVVDDRMEGSGGDGQIILCPDGTGGVPPLNVPFLQDSDCTLNKNTQLGDFDPAFWAGVRNGGVPFMDSQQDFATLEQNIAFSPELTLTSVTGYYEIEQDNLIRGSGSSNPTIAADFTFKNRQITEELRLTSDFETAVNFMVGGFYQDGDIEVINRLRGNRAFNLPALLQYGEHQVDIRSVSAFGQLLWQITNQFEVAAGARWTDEERTHSLFNFLTNTPVNLPVPRISADNVSPDLSVTYTPTDDLTVYAAYRQGFKSGSFNTIQVDTTNRLDFGDEKAEGGEIGLKARVFDRSLAFNLTAYYYEYSDLQVGANDLTETGAISLRTINAASAEVEGVDFDVTYSPSQIANLTLQGAVNYNRARFTDFGNAPCGNGQTIAEGCNQLLNPATGRFTSQDLAGRPLVRAPDWTATFGFDYELPIGSGLTLAIGSETRYSDKFFTNLVELPDYIQDSYFKTSANIALRGQNDAWEVALIGNNLGDEITAGLCSNSNTQNGTVFGGQLAGGPVKGAAGSDELGCVAERSMEVWLRLTYRRF
jgi:iron complex outermembrane receptor protein